MDLRTLWIKSLDQYEVRITGAAKRPARLQQLQLRYEKRCAEIAARLLERDPKHLRRDSDPKSVYDTGGRQIFPYFKVTGNPSKKGRALAEEWMRSQNIEWDGATKSLRRQVVQALLQREKVPNFGLGIKLTVQIRPCKKN